MSIVTVHNLLAIHCSPESSIDFYCTILDETESHCPARQLANNPAPHTASFFHHIQTPRQRCK